MNKVLRLQGVRFDWKKEEYPDLKFSTGTQLGLIAQNTEEIVPEVVTTDNNGYKGISYEKLVPVLIEAIKEIKTENEALRNKIAKIEQKLK